MSTRAVYKTKFDDKECLVEALKEVCGTSNVNARESDTISVRVQSRSASFRKNAEGTYDIVTTAEGQARLGGILVPETDGDGHTKNRLAQAYAKAKVLRAMKALKGTVVKDEVDDSGTQQIRIRTISFE